MGDVETLPEAVRLPLAVVPLVASLAFAVTGTGPYHWASEAQLDGLGWCHPGLSFLVSTLALTALGVPLTRTLARRRTAPERRS